MAARASREELAHVVDVEIRHAPAGDLAVGAQALERVDRLRERDAAAPMQQVKIESLDPEARETSFAGRYGAFSAGVVRIQLAHYKYLVTTRCNRARDDFLRTAVTV